MKTLYKPSFLRDLKSIKSDPIYEKVLELVFQTIPSLDTISEIPNVKRMKQDKSMYRIRLGPYRIGFQYDGESIIFLRFLHRKEIYRYFP